MPPAPQALLSAAANNRRDLSSRTPSKAWKRLRTPDESLIQSRIAQNTPRWKCYFLTDPKADCDRQQQQLGAWLHLVRRHQIAVADRHPHRFLGRLQPP